MPVYEYACKACGHEFEREQRITEDPIKTCPKCKARQAKRLISQTSFVLKGSGWYSDLYASSGKGDKADKDGKAEASEAGKSSGGDAGASDEKKKPKKDSKKGDSKSSSKSSKSSGKGAKGSKAAA